MDYYKQDKPVPEDTTTCCARCVIFSTPMEAPELDDKGEILK